VSAAFGTLRADVRIHLAREYHVGAGHGRGAALDSALFTEAPEGVEEPAIRYGHGVLRQAVYDLLQAPPLVGLRRCQASGGADDSRPWCAPRDGADVCPFCRIFGSPAIPSPWSFSTLRPVPPESPPPRPGARVVSRAAIDPRRRRAADATLFSEELGAPLTFTMTAERASDTVEEALDELALLAAAARVVPAIGADRRRGRGECRITVRAADAGVGADDLLVRFREAWLADEGGTPRAAVAVRSTPPDFKAENLTPAVWTEAEAAELWQEVRIVVRLDEPVIAGSRPLTGNVLESELYVPGGVLLGALAGRALAQGARDDEAAFLRVFRAGGVRFPDLLPVVDQGDTFLPAFPAPRDLFTCSRNPGPRAGGGHGTWSALLSGGDGPACRICRDEGKEDAKPERLKGYLAPLHTRAQKTRYTLDLEPREETKIQVEPRTGRVREASLYHRQTIPAGTLLAGTLLATPTALADLRRWLALGDVAKPLRLRLGKRHGRGYGAARMSWDEVPEKEVAQRRAARRVRIETLVDAGVPIPLVARSRVLLRDGLGRVRQSLSPADLGLPGDGDCAVVARQVGGFWRHVGLPRQQEPALEPGSVLLVTPGEADRDRLLAGLVALAEGRAVGERTAEGFGRFAVAPLPYGWDDARFASHDPDFHPRPVPETLRRASAVEDGGPLRHDPRARWTRDYEIRLRNAGIDPDRDEWRTLARLLYARAGDFAEPLLRAIEKGAGQPADALKNSGAAREPKPFLTLGAGREAWPAVKGLVEEAASDDREEVRALRTRALADALAQAVHPEKGRE
jgi:hypothetical protein